MNGVLWMAIVSIATWLAGGLLLGGGLFADVGYGMAGPLLAAAGSWVLIERTFRRDPGRVTALMLHMLIFKTLFVAIYVAAVVRSFSHRPAAFALSFTAYFLALNAVEAVWLHRLFAGRVPAAR
jgi:hypothetical protein